MVEAEVISIIQQISQLILDLKHAYGKRLNDKNALNKYVIAAQAKVEAFNEVIEILKGEIK
jgi:hypothetical protein